MRSVNLRMRSGFKIGSRKRGVSQTGCGRNTTPKADLRCTCTMLRKLPSTHMQTETTVTIAGSHSLAVEQGFAPTGWAYEAC